MSRQTAVWHNNMFCHVGICCLQFLLDMRAFAVNLSTAHDIAHAYLVQLSLRVKLPMMITEAQVQNL